MRLTYPDIDLSPSGLDNHGMGTVFEELVRRMKYWLRDGAMTFIPAQLVWKWIDENIEERAWYAGGFGGT